MALRRRVMISVKKLDDNLEMFCNCKEFYDLSISVYLGLLCSNITISCLTSLECFFNIYI